MRTAQNRMAVLERDRDAVIEELAGGSAFCLVTHERPDGDALGSLLGMHRILTALGKDSVMVMDSDDLPLPLEYRFLDLDRVVTTVPDDLDTRVIVFLDCGNIDRNPVAITATRHGRVLNIDHHHDNTRFGDVDFVDASASCTAEIVWSMMPNLGVEPDVDIAEALYVGLVTDTGKFMYENTSPAAHRMAAALLEVGVDAHRVYRRLYENVPFAKLELLGRALDNVARYDDGALAMVSLSRADFEAVGAEDSFSEGIIDHLRALEGTKVAAFARQQDRPSEAVTPRKKVSLRSTGHDVDVSVIARAGGGGGHPQAAGFTTELDDLALVAFLREQVATQLAAG